MLKSALAKYKYSKSFERVEQLVINMMQSMEPIQATAHRYLGNSNKLGYKSLSKLFSKVMMANENGFG